MKSRRSWLIGLALGAALFFGTPSAKAQVNTVPRTITYQGLLEQGSPAVPVNGNVTLEFQFFDGSGNKLFDEVHTGVPVLGTGPMPRR